MPAATTRAERRRDARRRHGRARGARRTGPRPDRSSRAQIIGAAAAAVLATIALIWAGNGGLTTPVATAAPGSASQPTGAAGQVVTLSEHSRGVAAAPVTIEEWADFQCPACGQFARLTVPLIMTSYVAAGQVRLVYRHFSFLGPESEWAAEAAECAGEQGRFFEYHDRLYASQAGENRGTFSKTNLKRLGAELGLGQTFAACVDSGRYAQAVRDQTASGQARGIDRTPTLFVNGRKIEGAATFEQLRGIIDPLLAGR